MIKRPNLLVVCERNKKRSRTAESIFKNDRSVNIRSAGLSPSSQRKLSEKDIEWADLILVMETKHKKKLLEHYPTTEPFLIKVLDIPDDYEFMDEELINILSDKITHWVLLATDGKQESPPSVQIQ